MTIITGVLIFLYRGLRPQQIIIQILLLR